ncbi:MAG: hypothetical protein P1P90_06700 [Patescibacteria group bacterium]|nr:hypothetical protein [Patescibacteria group bacterium]
MNTNIPAFIARFERDMQFDSHSNLTKIARSDAAEALYKYGKKALPFIVDHLEQNPPNEQLELHTCWGMLLNNIAVKLNIWEKPTTYEDTEGWIAWAKKETA